MSLLFHLKFFSFLTVYVYNSELNYIILSRNIAGRNINFRFADDSTLMPESKEELKSLLIKVKEQSEKAGLKLNIKKSKIKASGPNSSWQVEGENVTDFFSWALKSLQMVTAAVKLKEASFLEGKL